MAKDHFLPATYIARFAEENASKQRRERQITVHRKGRDDSYQTSVENIGYKKNLYNVNPSFDPTQGKSAVDNTWNTYEPRLNKAITHLVSNTATIDEWINVLFPFVSATFARDRGYKDRVAKRFAITQPPVDDNGLGNCIREQIMDPTNINLNRILEMSQYAARLLSYQWVIYRTEGKFILPDIGYSFEKTHENPDIVGIFLPLDTQHLLVLRPEIPHVIANKTANGFAPSIQYVDEPVEADEIDSSFVKTAQNFVAGSKDTIDSLNYSEMGIFQWKDIDDMLSISPFQIDSKNVIGLYELARDFINDKIKNLNILIRKSRVLSEHFPDMLIATTSDTLTLASRYLSVTGNALQVNFG